MIPSPTSVDTSTPETPPPADVYGWDWSATTHDARGSGTTTREISASLIEALGGSLYLPGNGLQGWNESVQVFDDGGFRLGTVYFGGERTDVHVVSTSTVADESRWAVVGQYDAKTSRVDTRVDTLVSFDDLEALCCEVAGSSTKVTYMESRYGDRCDGRTLYVGAPSSMVRIRVYEKWLESPGLYEEGTNRVEVQLRPPSRSKSTVSTWSPAETFCASKLSRRVAGALGRDVAHPGTLQKSKGTPDLEKTLQAMGNQYGKAVRQWLDMSQGDIGRVLDHMGV